MAKAAEAEAARIAEKVASEHAATDAEEDALYGPDTPELVPAELADPAARVARIDEAIARLNAQASAKPDDPDDHAGPPDDSDESTESVESGRVPRDRSARIAQARARIDAEIAAERAERDNAVREFLDRLAAGERVSGRPRAGTEVALAEDRLAEAQADKRVANITDPQSRMQPVRGGGWVQGYNCQAVTTADGLIVAAGVGTSPADNQYYRDLIETAVTAAELITSHRGPDSSGQAESIGIVLADAGYCTKDNLTAPGPDRLIATGKSRDLHAAATDNPAEGPPPDDSDPIAAMNHRLRTRKVWPPTPNAPTSPKPPLGTLNTTSAPDASPAAVSPGHAANGTSTPPCATSARSSPTSPQHHCPPDQAIAASAPTRQISDDPFRDSP